jgi:beta-1,4-mannosyl-glycoprotein beta-1,4-N-acetylglucosaminyltransferase
MAIQLSSLTGGHVFIGVVAFIIICRLLLAPPSTPSWRSYNFSSFSHDAATSGPNGFIPVGAELEEMCLHYRWKPFPDRYHHRNIYDLILVNDELDALELRMSQMSQVDYFVIVESATTFSDNEKPLYVQENRSRFHKFHHKMIVHTLNTTGQEFGDTWAHETFSRNAMFQQVFPTLKVAQTPAHGDVIIVGDVDELVRPEVLTALRNCEFPKRVKLWTRFYYYSFQWLCPEGHAEWGHPDATFFDGFGDTVLPQDLRSGGEPDSEVYSAGWHCSYCFRTLAEIVSKVKSFSHQEMNTPDFTDPRKILERVRTGRDMFARWNMFRIENNVDVPETVVKERKKWKYMLDRDGENAGFEDAWELIGEGDGDYR